MKPRKIVYLIAAAALFLSIVAPSNAAGKKRKPAPAPVAAPVAPEPQPVAPPVATSNGKYVDSAGDAHAWRINDSHALYWEGAPYEPIGGVLVSKFLSEQSSDENWRADIAALQQFKKNGVTSILIRPSGASGGILGVSSASFQAMVDVLEKMGFTYGIDLTGAPSSQWDAVVVEPSVYRSPAPARGATVVFRNIENVKKARFYLVSTDSFIIQSGDAEVTDSSTVSVKLDGRNGGENTVLLLYPECSVSTSNRWQRKSADIWSNADDYRDQLLLYLGQLKFGRGLRFFVDPFKFDANVVGQTQGSTIPLTDLFRIQFEAFLEHRYNNSVVRLRSEWGVKDMGISNFNDAAKARPLWYQSKGLALIVDPATGKTYDITVSKSKLWLDIHDFELQTIQEYMKGLAVSIKSSVADVPILYSWSCLSPAFVNHYLTGYDGLIAEGSDHGNQLVQSGLAFAFGAAEQAQRTQWLLSELPCPSDGVVDSSSRGVLTQDRLAAESVGIKGVFIDAPKAASWDDASSQWLGWLHADGASRTTEAEAFATTKPNALYYPLNAPAHGDAAQQIQPNVWWLPSFEVSDNLDLGSNLSGYKMKNKTGPSSFVVWSNVASAEPTQIEFSRIVEPVVSLPDGAPFEVHSHKGITSIPFTKTPMIISKVDSIPLPKGAFDEEYATFVRLLDLANKKHIPTATIKAKLQYVVGLNETNTPDDKRRDYYSILKNGIDELKAALCPYVWIEGEAPAEQNFESVAWSPDVSANSFLWLNSRNDPQGDNGATYHATYAVNVPAPDEYTVWAAIGPGIPGGADTSSIVVQVDNQPSVDVDHARTVGDPYGSLPLTGSKSSGSFVWCNLGTASLSSGAHRFTITVSARTKLANRYTLGIDALMFSTGGVTPSGVEKPKF